MNRHTLLGLDEISTPFDLVRVEGLRYFVSLVFQNQRPVQLTYSTGFRPTIKELKEMFALAGVPVRMKNLGRFLLYLRFIKTDKTTLTDQSP